MIIKKVFCLLLTGIFSVLLLSSCSNEKAANKDTVIVFHAGSLSVPMKTIKKEYCKKYPEKKVITNAAGSRTCARDIVDLHEQCDVFLSADYSVINQLLIPGSASWCIKFATNEMAIVYTDKSKYANEINKKNWYDILLKKDVVIGRSNPNDDPCGYCALVVMQLSEIYYKVPKLADELKAKKNTQIMRPKETDLLYLLESGNIDYIFLYKSIAKQHNLKYVSLPPQINLGNPKYTGYYKQAKVKLTGKKPGTFIERRGAPIIYGLTIPKNAPNPKLAENFIEFVLNKNEGLKILKEDGQDSAVPSYSKTYTEIPNVLKKYAKKSSAE